MLRRYLTALCLLLTALTTNVAPASPVRVNPFAVSLAALSPGAVAANRRRSGLIVPASITYDNAVGAGVDANGFASLPLYAGGTTGTDALGTTAPTSVAAGISYSTATRAFTGSAGTTNDLGTWANVLTPGRVYRLQIGIVRKSYMHITAVDENGNTLFSDAWPGGYDGSGNPQPLLQDVTFTASTGHNLIIHQSGDAFTSGSSVAIGILAPQTGAIPARRLYVKNGGSDGNPIFCLKPATPCATIPYATSLITSGAGDQILIAEGSSFTTGIPLLDNTAGRSAAYPLTWQSYDPNDPANEAKFGRASGANRPQLSTGGINNIIANGNAENISYLAFRGLKWAAPDLPGQDLTFVAHCAASAPCGAGAGGTIDYVLFENDILSNTSLSADLSQYTAAHGQHWIIRNVAQYGSWGSGGHYEPFYMGTIDGLTIEDSVLYHGGWRVNTSRDADISVGGLVGDQVFRHAVYVQNTTTSMIYRRNLLIEGPADCGHLLGDSVATENLFIDCPFALDMTGGVSYETVRPNGVVYQAAYNAIIGAEDLTSTDPRGIGIDIRNGAPGTVVHHNLLIRANNVSAGNRTPMTMGADAAKPTYAVFRDNISYLRATSGSTFTRYPDLTTGALTYGAALNNKWDDPTDAAGNTNVGSVTFPNAYTDTSLYTAAGYANRQALIDYAIANPEQHPQRTLLNLALAGYGITHTVGQSTSIAADTTAPTITGQTGTGTSPTTATFAVFTNKAGGRLHWVATSTSTPPTDLQIKAGQDSTGAAAAKAGSAEVTLPGAQSVGATGLTRGATYYFHAVHEDAWGNKSAVASTASFATPSSGLGPEINTDPNFANAGAWSLTGCTIASNTLTCTNANGWIAYHSVTSGLVTAGHVYQLDINVASLTTGTLRPYVGSSSSGDGSIRSAAGRYTVTVTAGSNNELGINASTFTGTVTLLSVKESF